MVFHILQISVKLNTLRRIRGCMGLEDWAFAGWENIDVMLASDGDKETALLIAVCSIWLPA